MRYSKNISTNILRDQNKEIDYVVTPNAKEIFDRIFTHNYAANKSFNLIGNYGTGKSTFLWALEKNLKNENIYFNEIYFENKNVKDYDFFKIIGHKSSLLKTFCDTLKIKKDSDSIKIIEKLEQKRKSLLKKQKGLVVIIDEFGKFLEYAAENNSSEELFLLQQISEWSNNDDNDTYFITTLHQNFSNYGKNLNSQDKLEWEKVKGRFVDLVFNEPVEQLIYFASKKLKEFDIATDLKKDFEVLLGLIKDSKLVSHNKTVSEDLSKSLYPLDWLSANVLVNSLQRYGQNERSLFSFLNDDTKYSIKQLKTNFYAISNVYDYLVNTLPAEINGPDNPHRAQWLTTFRTLERAELIFGDDYEIAQEVIKTIGLVNIFSKLGGLFDSNFIIQYFKLTSKIDVKIILDKLETAGLIRFYRHSNKINFFEGTDIDLEQELIGVSKELSPDIRISDEILNLVNLPVLLVKRYSFETGTKRFFEYRIFNSLNQKKEVEGLLDGFINLIFEDSTYSEIIKESKDQNDQIYVLYKNSKQIKSLVITIIKFDLLIKKHNSDVNAVKLLNEERVFYLEQLNNLVINELFNSNKNEWIYKGKIKKINNKHTLYEFLTEICYEIYRDCPVFNNELVNNNALSTPILVSKKYLLRALLANSSKEDLGFDKLKFPPEKAIYISLLKQSGIHKLNKKLGYFELSIPPKNSNLHDLWVISEQFLSSALSNKKNLSELYDILLNQPYKLKKGFVDFWIPIFLISKKEDYALFYKNGNYIPFLQEDTLDLIYKKPEDYIIKSYDVSGLKLNLLESYKELVQITDSNSKGIQSTFLSIFGNFLRFQRGLNLYTLNTKKLSNSAIKLREAIMSSKDPEDALFNQFPSALGYHTIALKEDEKVLSSFTANIQEAIREIRTAYDDLINRTESVILKSFGCSSTDFKKYKQEIILSLNTVNLSALSKKQSIFNMRLVNPLDDRVSWIKSVADVAVGKPLEELLDDEELLLYTNLEELILGLIKAAEISEFNKQSSKGKLLSIRFFGENGEAKDNKFFIKNSTSKDFNKSKQNIEQAMGTLNNNEKKELLIELLSKEMEF